MNDDFLRGYYQGAVETAPASLSAYDTATGDDDGGPTPVTPTYPKNGHRPGQSPALRYCRRPHHGGAVTELTKANWSPRRPLTGQGARQ